VFVFFLFLYVCLVREMATCHQCNLFIFTPFPVSKNSQRSLGISYQIDAPFAIKYLTLLPWLSISSPFLLCLSFLSLSFSFLRRMESSFSWAKFPVTQDWTTQRFHLATSISVYRVSVIASSSVSFTDCNVYNVFPATLLTDFRNRCHKILWMTPR